VGASLSHLRFKRSVSSDVVFCIPTSLLSVCVPYRDEVRK
jgi:hypothetical protein